MDQSSISERKASLRAAWLERRAGALGPEALEAESRAAMRGLAASGLLGAVSVVALYSGIRGELDPLWLLEEAAACGKRVVLPRVLAQEQRIGFYEVEGDWGQAGARAAARERLRPGGWGILEPWGEELALGQIELWVVPGLGFDGDGARLGYGKGHYDRCLAGRAGLVAGLCFDWQVRPLGELPSEAHDARVDLLVTPSGCWATGHGRAGAHRELLAVFAAHQGELHSAPRGAPSSWG
jgi:5-formyltetrahydrofolate cyclo-ligase